MRSWGWPLGGRQKRCNDGWPLPDPWAVRKKMFACVIRARCGVLFTPPVAYKGIVISCRRLSCEKKTNIDGPPTFERPTTITTLSILPKTKTVRTTNSIAIAFLDMVVNDSDGWVKSDNWFLVCLSDASLRLSWRLRNNLVSLSEVHSSLVHFAQASSCFRTVAARTTRQCNSYPRSGPNVCKYLRSIQWLDETLCAFPSFGITGESSFILSLQPDKSHKCSRRCLLSNTLNSGDTGSWKKFHFFHIMNYLLWFFTERIKRAIVMQIYDRCIFFGWFLTWCTSLLINRIRSSSSRSTAACDIPWILKPIWGSIFPSSATCFAVLVPHWW